MNELAGRTAVITGAASGIGLAMAHRFGREGMNLVLGDIEQDRLDAEQATLRAAGYDVAAHLVDVRDIGQVTAFEKFARERFGDIHVLCNNAGVGGGGPVADPNDLELWRWTIEVNLWGVIHGCKTFLPAMLAHGQPAHVVNTASMAGLGSAPMMGPYNISKYGVVALSETLSKEMQLGGTAVGVSVLCPEFVRTAIATSHRNLPAELRTNESAAPREVGEFPTIIEQLVESGIEPGVVADAVHDAVLANRFWILTHPASKDHVIARAEQIANGDNPVVGGFA